MRSPFRRLMVSLAAGGVFAASGCTVAPAEEDRPSFGRAAGESAAWFKQRVPGLAGQIAGSAGYAVFPESVQWGMLLSGGSFGRGAVFDPEGTQIGWVLLNGGSLGLQFGTKTSRLLLVFENETVLRKFQDDQLLGTAGGVAVFDKSEACARAAFDEGVALYEGGNQGLMLGVNLALNLMRYEPLRAGQAEHRAGGRSALARAASIPWPHEHQ